MSREPWCGSNSPSVSDLTPLALGVIRADLPERVETGVGAMPSYRIYTVGSDNSFILGEDIECADEEEAIKKAAQAAKDSDIELWDRGRCVVRLLPAPSPKWKLPSVGLDESASSL